MGCFLYYDMSHLNSLSAMDNRTAFHSYTFIAFLIISSCSTPAPESGQPNNIRAYLTAEGKDITENALSDISTLSDWENQRYQRYHEFIEMMGIQDMPLDTERPDLNIRITGTIQKEGYRIEKLYYESLPGLYVPANLYIPDNIEEPRPAILYVCGHSPTQKVHYQPYPRKFAELGFVCLIIETIQFGEVRGHHHGCYYQGWFNWYSRGYNPGGVEAWNGIRGLDLLAERPEVDPEKLGVTGISGGGSQTWYIAAADPRIKAAAPVCGASTLKAHMAIRTVDGHCDCMMPINTYLIDFQDIGALIAPRPLLIAQADGDGMNTIESIRELHDDIKKMYDLYGVPENIGLVETPGGHSYHKISRQEIHSFFLEHLMDKKVAPSATGDIDETPENLLSEDELRVYTDGLPNDDRTPTIQDSFVQLHGDPEITNEKDLVAFRDSVKHFLSSRTFGAFPKVKVPFDPRLEFRALDGAKYGWTIHSFLSEEGWRLKLDFRWRNEPDVRKPMMIVLRNYDEDRWDSESFISGLEAEWNIAYLEVRGIGENGWEPALQWHVRRASAWTGRTIASMQVYDVLRSIEFCRTLEGVDPDKIGIAARDDMTVVAMYSALLDGKCHTLILLNPPASQDRPSRPDGRGAAIEMLNCLRITDLYQLPALLIPAKINFRGDVPETYQWSVKVLQDLGKDNIISYN
jgi:hypothetical protein